MDRNSIVGLLLIVGIVFVFTFYQNSQKQEQDKTNQDTQSQVEQRGPEQPQATKTDAISNQLDTIKDEATKMEALKNMYGTFASAGVGQKEFYTLENDLIKVVFSNKGGIVYSVQLKKYTNYKKEPLILFKGDSTQFALNFATTQNRSISTGDLFFVPVNNEKTVVVNQHDSATHFALRLLAGDQQYLEYDYSLAPGSYKLNFNIKMVGMDKVVASNWNSFDLRWSIYVPQQEKGRENEETYTSIFYKYFQEDAEEMPGATKEYKEFKIDNKIKWIAFKQQFFSSVLIAGSSFEYGMVKSQKIHDSTFLRKFTAEATIPFKKEALVVVPLSFYFGPNHYTTLKKYGDDLEELVKLGKNIIKWINRFLIIPVFNFLNRFISNYGIIILILTLLIKLLLFPLTYSSYLSQAKMRVLKPQIDEINAKISADKPMERQQATMALYKRVGVSPLGGCLPMMLQFPILIAMFRFFPTSIELRQQGFLWAKDLSTYDAIYEWTQNIPFITSFYGNHISLFTILMTVTTLITVKMNSQMTSSAQMPGMKYMTYLMPLMFMFILNKFSAGLTYYYFLANLITIGQNEIFKLFVDENKILAQLNENKKKPVKKSKWQERIELMAKNKGYKLPPKK